MVRIAKANISEGNMCDGVWVMDGYSESSLYIPFSLCIVIADAITFSDPDVIGCCEMAGYIEIYYDYDESVQLSDGREVVTIMKDEIVDFSKALWDLV